MISKRRELLLAVYERLYQAFGPQHWWPADTPSEVIIGAILTQNTSWKNVRQSIQVLRQHGLLNFEALSDLPVSELASMIRSSGYYNQKARKLKAFCEYLRAQWQGDLSTLLSREMDDLRRDLLQVHGIGPETADCIVLYAAYHPSFVVDAYTHRIFHRHGWIGEEVDYHSLRDYFMQALEPDVTFFQEYHALLVRTGHLHCRRKPNCLSCPLNNRRE